MDIGDADIVHTDTMQSHTNIKAGVKAILDAGAFPVVIGGDHSINIPCIDAFEGQGDIHILQIDAHLDFVDERHGVRYGHGNPMRRAAEKPYVTGLTQVGIRNVSSTAKEGYEDARRMGSDILSVRQMRALGPQGVIDRIPKGARVYVTLDIDAFCPSIALAPVRPRMVALPITRCSRCCRRWRGATRLWESIWSRWRPITTRPARPRFWPRRCC